MRRMLLIAALLGACSSSDPYTWGDLSNEMSGAYCHALNDPCGNSYSDKYLEVCTEHSAWHLCVPDDTCEVEIDEQAAESAMATCQTALDKLDHDGCLLLNWYGVVPAECDGVLGMHPLSPD